MRAILDAFPGAKIESVNDSRADAYGLPAEPAPLLGTAADPIDPDSPGNLDPDNPDMPDGLDTEVPDLEFAPDDAVFVDDIGDAPAASQPAASHRAASHRAASHLAAGASAGKPFTE